jgi:hypothetical protein
VADFGVITIRRMILEDLLTGCGRLPPARQKTSLASLGSVKFNHNSYQ